MRSCLASPPGLVLLLAVLAAAAPAPAPPPAAAAGFVYVPIEDANRIVELNAAGQVIWQAPVRDPDDVSVTPAGNLLVNEPDLACVVELDRRTGRVLWHYGHAGHPGSAPGFLRQPDDSFRLADGTTLISDSGNQRVIRVDPAGRIVWQYGHTGRWGTAPGYLAAPNDAVPLRNGNILITTEYPPRVLEVTPAGAVRWSLALDRLPSIRPAVRRASDAVPTGKPDRYLVAVYERPGRILELDHLGRVHWSYGPATGPGALDHPSAVIGLPDGNILISDDGHDRVLMVNHGGRVLWHYGNPRLTPGVSDVKPVSPWPIAPRSP
ncbi:MAG: PQQ-binding-like beta-propeller repeat protein [Rhodospirillales bacterium]|nr:PQQ-binding-like beta-propeller repeat protein [Rhodospirillales bacterium]